MDAHLVPAAPGWYGVFFLHDESFDNQMEIERLPVIAWWIPDEMERVEGDAIVLAACGSEFQDRPIRGDLYVAQWTTDHWHPGSSLNGGAWFFGYCHVEFRPEDDVEGMAEQSRSWWKQGRYERH